MRTLFLIQGFLDVVATAYLLGLTVDPGDRGTMPGR